MSRVGLRGKVCYFTRKDIKNIDPDFDLINLDEKKLYDLLEEFMGSIGFVFFDNDFVFNKEIVVNGWHERRYSCMILRGKRIKGRFILESCGIQFHYII